MSFPGLPTLFIPQDAALFRHTVGQFLPQFFEIEDVLFGAVSLWEYFMTTNPAILGLHLLILWTSFTLLASIITGNYSWTDRFWSITPTSYVTMLVVRAYFTGEEKHGMLHSRLLVMWCMYLLWTVRLTGNYYRRGGYEKGSEDYRWGVIRSKIGDFQFFLFQLVYIPAQNVLVAALALPAYEVFLIGDEILMNWRDVVAISTLLAALLGQLIADDTQHRFQSAKQQHSSGATDSETYRHFSRIQLERGFVTTGLWEISRHPSYFLEQIIWSIFYLWGAVTTTDLWNYAVVGPIAYIVLFQGSTRLTEEITAKKYGAYRFYQKKVGMLCPVPYFHWDWDDTSKSAATSGDAEILANEDKKAQ